MIRGNGLFSRILVPVDGSRFSMKAVDLAEKIAMIHGSKIRLVHVADTVVLNQLCKFSQEPFEKVRENLMASGLAFLNDMASQVRKAGISVSTLLKEGSPHEVILGETEDWNADLIVIGKLGKRGVSRILLGSVAERIIEFANIPVLVAGNGSSTS